jgi:hypothetical protein
VSLSNRGLCEYMLFIALFVVTSYPFSDPDGWWHLRTGQHIVETASIPSADIFSGTRAGAEWVTHEWLTELLMYALYRLGGFGLLTIAFALIPTAAFWITYRRSEGRPFVAAFSTMLGAAAAYPVFGVRPQIISLFFVSIVLALVDSAEVRPNLRRLWWLVPLTVLWVNLHAGFALGIALIGLRIAGRLLDGWLLVEEEPVWRELKHLTGVLATCLLAVVLNPSTTKLYGYPFETMFRQTEQLFIQEWQSPNFHLGMFQFFAALSLVTFAVLILSKERLRPSTLLMLLATFYASLQAGRHIPIFALVAIPVLARHLTQMAAAHEWFQGLLHSQTVVGRGQTLANSSFLFLMVVFAVATVGNRISDQRQTETAMFPRKAVDFIEASNLEGPIFNVYEWGGYLIWRLHPEVGPYIDGRPEIYGDAYVEEFLGVYTAGADWREVLDGAGVRTVLLRPGVAIGNILEDQPDWRKAFEDTVAVVFTRP